MIKEISDNNFEQEVIEEGNPVVVDFWAPWCGPCRMLSPVIDEIAKEFSGKVKFVKVNVDENPALSSKFNVMSIPTVMVFKGGSMVESMVGFRPKPVVKSTIEKHL